MLDTASKILFLLSSGLLLPVILALLFLSIWMLLVLGGFVREFLARRMLRRPLAEAIDRMTRDSEDALGATIASLTTAAPASGFIPRYLRACRRFARVHPAAIGKTVDEIEIEMARRVASLSAIARLGPMLGLAGTLIPLGPGLVNLARGDIAGLANHLVIAFSTTVVGLLVGMVAFTCAHIRRGWYAQDFINILFMEQVRSGAAEEVPA